MMLRVCMKMIRRCCWTVSHPASSSLGLDLIHAGDMSPGQLHYNSAGCRSEARHWWSAAGSGVPDD